MPRLSLLAAVASVVLSPRAFAGYAPAPNAYTLTQVNAMFGKPVPTTIFRDGAAAVMESAGDHVTRQYFDLAHGRSYSWNPAEPSPTCGSGTFSGDWGDPFTATASLLEDLNKLSPKEVGAEDVNGLHTKVFEAEEEGKKLRVWIDTTYGLLTKWVAPGPDGKPQTIFEVKSLKLGKPAAVNMTMPATCAKLASQPLPPSDAERIAALTSSAPGAYLSASTGQPSKETCAVLLSVVQGKTMAPLNGGFRLGVDPTMDVEHPAAHEMGASGKPFFQGGGIREMTNQIKGGVVRLDNLGAAFDVEIVFGNGSNAASALIYRRCSGKDVARLFYVVRNPAKLSEGGEWLWAK